MSIDIEQQIASYFEWLDQSTGTSLHKSSDIVELDDDEADVVEFPRSVSTPTRRSLMMIAVAAVLVAAVALVVVRGRAGDDGIATGQRPSADASWYVIDPASSFGNLGDGTVVDVGETKLSCRRYDAPTEKCTELVGQKTFSYDLSAGQTVTVTTDIGHEPSVLWQTLEVGAEAGQVAGHPGLVNSTVSAVGFEATAGTHVVVMASPPTSLETLTDIAASLTLVHEAVTVPIVFGDSAPRFGEIPVGSIGARYYAGYVDLADSCVGSFGVPWNGGEAKCVEVPDDRVTVTVASPSPAGTILIAALPSATSSAEIAMQDGPSLSGPPVAVTGFSPKLLFIDLDGAIPSHLTARDSSGAVIDEADITSTGGAPLGYLPVDPTSVPRTFSTTEHQMTAWPVAASSRPYTSNAGYGMTLCSGGTWTKFAVIATRTRWEHSYQGTLCTFTTLGHPIGDTIASCASMSVGPNYAQCKLLADPEQEAPTLGDIAEPATDVQPEDAAVLPPTPSDLPQIFSDKISAVSLLGSDQYSDDTVSVTLSEDLDPQVACFRIELDDVVSEGCLGSILLATGLAYGAFERGDGPIDVVGIVPDDVVSVEIGGQFIAVRSNVWHYTGQPGEDLTFTVRSSDGSVEASVS
jgi:hypothetical protein